MKKINRREFLKKSASVASTSLAIPTATLGKTKNLKISETSLIASISRESFYEFTQEFWETIIVQKPVWNWHIKYICNELQKIMEYVFAGKPKLHDEIINVSPGSTKSTICSVMLTPWAWTRMPHCQIIGGSYSDVLSVDLARKARDVILSDKYQAVFPEIKLRSDQAGKSYYMNKHGGWRYATSTGGTVTGFHGHVITVDDPLNPNQAVSEVELKNANNWMSDTLEHRKVDQALTPTILIMQRLHQDDPTAAMIERAKETRRIAELQTGEKQKLKLKHICIPAELTDDVKPKKLRKKYKNNLMDEIRLSQAVLNGKKAAGAYFYAGQYLQNPVPLGGGMFKTDRIIIDVVNMNKIIRLVRFWDKAGTYDDGAYTVGFLMGVDTVGRYWLLDCIRGQWGSDQRESLIKQTAQIDGQNVIIGVEQEPGSGGKHSMEMTVKNLAGFSVRVDKPSGAQSSKTLRADPFSVQVNAGNVSMVKAEWNTAFLDELRYFPNSKYKDQVDSASGAFNILTSFNVEVGAFLRN